MSNKITLLVLVDDKGHFCTLSVFNDQLQP